MNNLSDRLRDEADLCRTETADDIALLLDEAAAEIDRLSAAQERGEAVAWRHQLIVEGQITIDVCDDSQRERFGIPGIDHGGEEIISPLYAAPAPAAGMEDDTEYLIGRLRRIKELIDAGEYHMACTKILADISALSAPAAPVVGERDEFEAWMAQQTWPCGNGAGHEMCWRTWQAARAQRKGE